jgi:hypothetical protein
MVMCKVEDPSHYLDCGWQGAESGCGGEEVVQRERERERERGE